MGCKPHNAVIDCTVQNVRACDYCAAIGMGTMPDGVTQRCSCPARQEGDPQRGPCETYLTEGTVLESRNGATCEFVEDNPFMFKPNAGNCRLCGANGTTYKGERLGCGAWY
jgi:hypothetical protein